MNYRDRILAALHGQAVDHIPWAPRWDLWFNAASRSGQLPERYLGWHIFDVSRDLGIGIWARVNLVRTEFRGVEVTTVHKEGETITEYHTPFGVLRTRSVVTEVLASEGVSRSIQVEHPVKTERDYDAAIYLVEHTKLIPMYDAYEACEQQVGTDGVVLAWTRMCPAHLLMREYTGYEKFYYELQDHPAQVEKLLTALTTLGEELQRIAVESPAVIVQHDGNYDGQLTPPPIYRKYFLPFFQQFAAKLHATGKLFATHADGHNEGLLELLEESGFDIIEAFTPPPMTRVSIENARRVWGNRLAIWGGLAAVVFSDYYPWSEFEDHVYAALESTKTANRLVLGVGDNIPVDGSLERILFVRDAVARWPVSC